MPSRYDPTDWIDEWPIPGLFDPDRKRIKAVLLKAHAAYLRSDQPEGGGFIEPMEESFSGVAEILFNANLLDHGFLGGQLRVLIIEFALRAKWLIGPVISGDLRQDLVEAFPGYWVHPGPWIAFNSSFKFVFGAPIAEWRARLLEREAEVPDKQSAIVTEQISYSNTRQMFLMPLLQAKGWSLLDWAVEAEVAPATVQDYLANKTKPHPSTRLKLAKSLGISIQELPH